MDYIQNMESSIFIFWQNRRYLRKLLERLNRKECSSNLLDLLDSNLDFIIDSMSEGEVIKFVPKLPALNKGFGNFIVFNDHFVDNPNLFSYSHLHCLFQKVLLLIFE
jgi:hypothetical protein